MKTTLLRSMLYVVAMLSLLMALLSCSNEQPAGAGGARKPPDNAGTSFVSIGTGGVTGVYYQVGAGISKLLNARQSEYGVTASFQATGGSVYNINALMSGAMEIGVAQSDRQYQALNGLAEWRERGPQSKLRAVCSMHPEAVTLVASVDSGIRSLEDLRGKRVNIGNPGSGQRGNALDILNAAGIDPDSDLHAENLKAAEAPKMLQDGRIDAFFYTVGHPAGAITEATAGRRQVRFVPIVGMDALIEKAPYYAEATIPIALYPKAANTADVATVGVMTTVVTAEDIPETVIYAVTREIFENLDALRAMHPAFETLTRENMMTKGISAPFHEGAKRYFREKGYMD